MSQTPPADGHERWEGDAAAYALRALEEHEMRLFEAHLSSCPRCQGEVAQMQAAVDALATAASHRQAPVELKQRVMSAVREDVGLGPSSADAVRASGWRRPRAKISRAPVLAAAATAAIVVALIVGVLSLGGGQTTRTYAGTVNAPGASASVRVSGRHARLVFGRLPTLPRGLIYEMWLERGQAAPVPAGALFANTTGEVAVPGTVHGVRAVLVTAEPRPSGTRKPTRPPIVVVRLT